MTAPPPLHALEGEVMEEMWGRGEATVRDVQQALNARGGKVRAYTTLLTVMTRLDGKGVLARHIRSLDPERIETLHRLANGD